MVAVSKHWRGKLAKATRVVVGLVFTAVAGAHVLGLFPGFGVIERLDSLVYDLRLRAQVATPQHDPRIVIIDIDEKSLAEVGRWPWSRDVVAQLVSELIGRQAAAVVAFDVVFAEPQQSDAPAVLDALSKAAPTIAPTLKNLAPALLADYDRDAQLASSLRAGAVVLGYYFNQNPDIRLGALPAPLFSQADLAPLQLDSTDWQGFGANLQVLQDSASGGFFNPMIDSDGTVRTVPLLARIDGHYYESFALATLRTALGQPQLIPVFPEDVDPSYGAVEYLALRSPELSLDIPAERGLIARVNYRATGGPQAGGYTYVSAVDVLKGKLQDAQLEGLIVLVGTTAPGLLDLRSTPVNPAFPGVEVHANLLSSMLDGQYLMQPEFSQGLLFVAVLLLGVLLSVGLPLMSPLASVIFAVSAITLALGLNSLAYFQFGMVLPVAVLVLLATAIFVFNVAYGFLAESRSKRLMVGLFGEYVAPELVSEMAQDPKRYSMEGELRELTVMFSDVRGFTTISESLAPNELREYINEYLTSMSEVIRAHRGTLDKYIGDAIMAFWGAPVPDSDHASLATQAAIAMQIQAIELNERFAQRGWPKLAIGVGVNTGPMRVGDMGSKIRRAYTVMGDAVNLGSRLEGITKTYGVGVLVGPHTFEQAKGFAFQELDRVRVKGKHEPVPIYWPVGLKSELSEAQYAALNAWGEVLECFRTQRWAECRQALGQYAQATANAPNEVLLGLMAQRLEYYEANSPGDDWDGVTNFDTK